MKVRRLIASTALAVGLVAGTAAAAGAQDSPPASVQGVTIERGPQALPKTGGDFNGEVLVGVGLTAAGAALALAARERRRRVAVRA